jgi:hypothetical protein
MTTIVFKKVVDRIFRRCGLDPTDSDVNGATFRSLVEHINDRLYSAWFSWEWRFIEFLEQRAWRQVWNVSFSYDNGTEVFFPTDGTTPDGYYQAIQNVPGSTAITNTAYWKNIDPLQDIYLEYAQPFENVIGQVVELYDTDPRTNHHARLLDFQPSTKGIDVSYRNCPGIPKQVWVKYKPPPPEFTAVPYVVKTYSIGDKVFQPSDGQCYLKAFPPISTPPGPTPPTPPPPSIEWQLIEFPERFSRFVTAGAYADLIRDMEKGVSDPSPKLVLAQAAENEAMNFLLREIDIELAQGQKMYFSIKTPRRRRHDIRVTSTAITTI